MLLFYVERVKSFGCGFWPRFLFVCLPGFNPLEIRLHITPQGFWIKSRKFKIFLNISIGVILNTVKWKFSDLIIFSFLKSNQRQISRKSGKILNQIWKFLYKMLFYLFTVSNYTDADIFETCCPNDDSNTCVRSILLHHLPTIITIL